MRNFSRASFYLLFMLRSNSSEPAAASSHDTNALALVPHLILRAPSVVCADRMATLLGREYTANFAHAT